VLTATLPSQLNPFDIPTNYPDCHPLYPCVSRWEATITGWSLNSDRIYRPATTAITHIEDIGICMRVDVEVRNDGAEPLMDVVGGGWHGCWIKGI
jgi:hypothetical protein